MNLTEAKKKAFLTLLLGLVGVLVTTYAPTLTVILMVVAGTLCGLPHGAMDVFVGSWWLRPQMGRWWWLPFGAGYLALALLVILLWWLFSVPSLMFFVAVSFWHFSFNGAENQVLENDSKRRFAWTNGLWRGLVVIVVPGLLHPSETGAIFDLLTNDDRWVGWLKEGRSFLLVAVGAGFVFWLSSLSEIWRKKRPCDAYDVATIVLTLIALITPTLVAFSLYFCLWHSPAHSREMWAEISQRMPSGAAQRLRLQLVGVTALTLFLMLIGFLFLPATLSLDGRLLSVFFVGLAALTMPHMLLEKLWDRAKRRGP